MSKIPNHLLTFTERCDIMLRSMTSYKPIKMANVSLDLGDSAIDKEKLRIALIWLCEHAECTYTVWHKPNYTELECSMPADLVDDFKTSVNSLTV